ncbi:MAG: hypothetical protein L6247_05280 [Desulfobacteraceae bacterium]|nr:hypothetical protein [Pseudomonadota bacterium]MCG2754965.1 hypothetical protein [Desulfobacteraceae bacterium]
MQTSGYGGKKIRKNILVQTNDKIRPGLSVTVTGCVEKFADIRPQRIILRGSTGQTIKAQVEITPGTKYPFKIISAMATHGKYIKFSIPDAKRSNAGGYVLTVENIRKEIGRYNDVIYLKTDSKLRPTIPIYVIGNILSTPPDRKK